MQTKSAAPRYRPYQSYQVDGHTGELTKGMDRPIPLEDRLNDNQLSSIYEAGASDRPYAAIKHLENILKDAPNSPFASLRDKTEGYMDRSEMPMAHPFFSPKYNHAEGFRDKLTENTGQYTQEALNAVHPEQSFLEKILAATKGAAGASKDFYNDNISQHMTPENLAMGGGGLLAGGGLAALLYNRNKKKKEQSNSMNKQAFLNGYLKQADYVGETKQAALSKLANPFESFTNPGIDSPETNSPLGKLVQDLYSQATTSPADTLRMPRLLKNLDRAQGDHAEFMKNYSGGKAFADNLATGASDTFNNPPVDHSMLQQLQNLITNGKLGAGNAMDQVSNKSKSIYDMLGSKAQEYGGKAQDFYNENISEHMTPENMMMGGLGSVGLGAGGLAAYLHNRNKKKKQQGEQ